LDAERVDKGRQMQLANMGGELFGVVAALDQILGGLQLVLER